MKNGITRLKRVIGAVGSSLILSCCAGTSGPYTYKYAGAGTVLGGITGAVVAHEIGGKRQKGAAIGAGLGLITGAAIGDARDVSMRRSGTVARDSIHNGSYQPPGHWELVVGRWSGRRWVPRHWEWIPEGPRRSRRW